MYVFARTLQWREMEETGEKGSDVRGRASASKVSELGSHVSFVCSTVKSRS